MAIFVESISLAKLELDVHPEYAENREFNISLECQNSYPEPNHLVLTSDFDLARNVDQAPFTFRFTFVSVFRSDGGDSPTLEEFAESIAPAYVMPYARELVADITSRLGIIPPLLLPPINVFQLMQESKLSTED